MAQHLSGPSSLKGHVALITGGSGGMGRAIANAFRTAGAATIATAPVRAIVGPPYYAPPPGYYYGPGPGYYGPPPGYYYPSQGYHGPQ